MLCRAARAARLRAALLRPAAAAQPAARSPLVASISWRRSYSKNNEPDLTESQKPSSDETKQPYSGSRPESAAQTPKDKDTPDAANAKESRNEAAAKGGETEPEAPTGPLPDLTQGIPSTLEYEMAGKSGRSALQAIADEEAYGGGRAKGELPDSAYVSSSERKRQQLANRMFAAFLLLGAGSIVYLGRNWEDPQDAERHADVPNGWGVGLWWNRASTRMKEFLNYYQEPAFEKLLPDPDPSFERPYTLCISLEDMLVHSEWSREHGWRIAKRPGIDYFLRYLSQYYELVLFTTVPFAMGEPLVRKLDPFRLITWPLYREATKYQDGEIIKDLSYLNRDLSKVIVIDTKPEHVRNHPANAIILDKWTGDPTDKELVSLIPFLEYIHTMQYGDVRKVLKSFDGKHIPTEFARREAMARAEFNKQIEAQKGRKKTPSGMGILGNMLGLKPSNMSMMAPADGELTPAEAFAQGKMLQDIARERGQRNYLELERAIRENGEQWLKEEAAMQEKMQQEAMNSMMGSFAGWFVPAKKDNPSPGEKTA
ncbi:NIF-domain-containing protein [Sodiomyces alkalinus F11]|uniref:Mitochondrial import inner membrane translocase subunit TIM50 n=1 Tax=Sodiomyces alkalinus (strain CBS 110278 / VKM F-3762 / F11) TaxID=1314773 RepID=A0A3N2PYQ2_SODAK|nr:NIF-domain-containing protein [Sodiomyces alkalinus F11]ROT39661.1 NIF-domain-containing protein [Sodiomyces alkalinus F11]